ncbi:MAG: FAD-dependent oxidoreductase [Bacteroidetes bacterium]|nr:MAG: FAD-dependent oxidoreductase [Bacteroidota bacterium]
MKNRPKVVIIGAGFGGISIAKKLSKENVDIILIDRNNYHMFQPLLYQVATGGLEPSNIAYPVRRVFRDRKNVKFRMAEVINVNTSDKVVNTNLFPIEYDYLIIATGSKNNFFNFDPISDHFHSLKTVTDALDIRNTLMQNLEKLNNVSDETTKDALLNISIIGAGPAGVEIAGALAEMRKKVLPRDFPEFDFNKMNIYLFEGGDRVLANMSQESSDVSLKYLTQLGVDVKLNALVKDFDGNTIELADGTTYKSSTAIWTAGVKAAPIGGIAPKYIAKADRILVNEYNQLLNNPDVFAIGDVAVHVNDADPQGLPMLAQVAIQQGEHLAKNIARLCSQKEMIPFDYNDKGIMATTGRNKAVVDLPRIKFQGVFAWFVWMFIHLMSLVGFRNKLITFIDWTQNYFNYDRPLGAIIRKYGK